ncbi:MAG: hypothetical protein AAGF23_13515 [Acidobacteriota bacterium]
MSIRYLVAGLALASAAAAGPSGAAPCPPLHLESVSPNAAEAGSSVELKGEGFCEPARNYFAWGWDGSRGFPVTVDRARPQRLRGTVGPTPVVVSGPVQLWSGDRRRVPRGRVDVGGVRYRMGGTVLRAADVAGAADGEPFTADPGSRAPGVTATSTLVDGAVRLSLPAPPKGGEGFTDKKPIGDIKIIIVVETCGPPDDDDEEEGEDGASKRERYVGDFVLRCRGDRGDCGRVTAPAVAAAVNRGFEPGPGIPRADVEGSDVVISTPTCPISAGFATVHR